MTVTLKDYESNVENTWCPGCGNFGILTALKNTLFELRLAPHEVLICSGIGQAPKLPHYMKVNTLNGLHGREVAHAVGAKIAAPHLTVLVHGGDGGIYGEGGNHLLHNIRRNPDITVCVHDNRVYGLTKGQASPTTPSGTPGPIDPRGVSSFALNPTALAISQRCSFVAQGFSAEQDHLIEILRRAISHKGFSLVNILQPCVSWDKKHTYAYFKEHCYTIREKGGADCAGDGGDGDAACHDSGDLHAAFKLAVDSGEKIPLGVFYKEKRPVFEGPLSSESEVSFAERIPHPEGTMELLTGKFC